MFLQVHENISKTLAGIKIYTYLCKQKGEMPTLLRLFGVRFFFYLDEHRPIHVHVEHGGKLAKIELEPEIVVVYNHGIKESALRMAVDTCKIYKDQFIEEWYNRFGE